MSDRILEVEGLVKHFDAGHGRVVHAVEDVSLEIGPHEVVGLVGESGSGKSTVGNCILRLLEPTAGTIRFDGQDIYQVHGPAERDLRLAVQMVFQDPYGSLNPRKKISSILAEPLVINTDLGAAQRAEAVTGMMRHVGLRPETARRYPHMFSGGQRQRIAIARALVLKPKIVVLDEPVSALDLSIQAQVLNLLVELQQEFELAYLFISHNLSVVRHFAEEVLVMYLGKAVEHGTREAIFASPQHPYTRALLAASPTADTSRRGRRVRLRGELPSPLNPPTGCPFHPRCPLANERCRIEVPPLYFQRGREVACHAVEEGREAA